MDEPVKLEWCCMATDYGYRQTVSMEIFGRRWALGYLGQKCAYMESKAKQKLLQRFWRFIGAN